MADTRFQVSKPIEPLETSFEIVRFIESLIDELNLNFRDLEELQRQLLLVESGSSVSLTNGRLRGLSASTDRTDAVTRGEVLDLGLPLGNPGRTWYPRGTVNVEARGLKVPTAINGNDAVRFDQLNGSIEGVVVGAGLGMPTIRDGNVVDIEDAAGTDGATGGTLLFAATEEDRLKAKVIRQTPRGLSVDTGQVEQLLYLVLEKLEEISNKLG